MHTFDFISAFMGDSDYRVWNGRTRIDGRLRANGRKLSWSDGRDVAPDLLADFNAFRRAQHAAALEKHGPEFVEPFQPYAV